MASSWCLSRADTYAVMSATRGPRSSWGGEGAGVFFVTFGPGTRPLWPVLAFCVWLPDMASRGRGPLVRYCTPERPGPQMWSCSPMPKQPNAIASSQA